MSWFLGHPSLTGAGSRTEIASECNVYERIRMQWTGETYANAHLDERQTLRLKHSHTHEAVRHNMRCAKWPQRARRSRAPRIKLMLYNSVMVSAAVSSSSPRPAAATAAARCCALPLLRILLQSRHAPRPVHDESGTCTSASQDLRRPFPRQHPETRGGKQAVVPPSLSRLAGERGKKKRKTKRQKNMTMEETNAPHTRAFLLSESLPIFGAPSSDIAKSRGAKRIFFPFPPPPSSLHFHLDKKKREVTRSTLIATKLPF